MNEKFFIYNGRLMPEGKAVITSTSRGFRYGDGLFETMLFQAGKIRNEDFHFDRLFHGMKLLQFEKPENLSREFFVQSIKNLLVQNATESDARIRLMIFRNEGNIFDAEKSYPDYIIETFSLNQTHDINEKGLQTDIFPLTKKSCDEYSNLKTNNYLRSLMAARFAKKNHLDDALILNTYGRICESSISNIFVIMNDEVYTPPLSDGCVAGTMRRWFLENFSSKKYIVIEKELSIESLINADGVFLTNAIHPVRWVQRFKEKKYGNEKVKEIYHSFIQSM